jgi:ATP-dependent DNA helicase RecG
MEEDISLPRNPISAKFFRIVKLAENAGYGFDKMISGWKTYTGNTPVFEQGRDYTKATFYFKNKRSSKKKLGDKVGDKVGDKKRGNDKKPMASEELILKAVSKNPTINIQTLSKQTGLGKTAVDNNIKKLKEKGLLERVGSKKTGQWKVNM